MIRTEPRQRLQPYPLTRLVPEVRQLHDHAAWNRYVASHPSATSYHRYEWLTVIQESFGHDAIPMAAFAESGMVGILPLVEINSWLFGHFLVSLPFVNYGGVLADSPGIEAALWARAVELAQAKGARYVEARHCSVHPFIAHRKHHKATLVLDLAPSVEAQWKSFDSKLRNQIRKAELAGLTARIGGVTDLPAFYDIFARNMRDLGTPVYGPRFFAEILHRFPESARVVLVHRATVPVAAAIAIASGETLQVPWAGSRREARALCPNMRLYWELIQHAIKAGFRRFDFGRSTPDSGPYKFKQQWGAMPVPLYWEYWTRDGQAVPDLSPLNPKYQHAIRLWKCLPLSLTNRLGPYLVRNIP
jgi:FemAB-related protein (PEP-CTERM system-associated)